MTLEHLVERYGYAAVLVGTFLEGETILVIAGVAAQLGRLELRYVMICAFVGSLISDQLAFFIGRRWGTRWLARRPNIEARVARARGLIERHQIPITLGFRFLYGLRNVIPFALGMSRMKTTRYIVLNVIGAAVWAVALGSMGWGFGKAAELFIGHVKTGQKWFLLALAVAAGIFFLVYKARDRRQQRKRLAAQDPSTKTPSPL